MSRGRCRAVRSEARPSNARAGLLIAWLFAAVGCGGGTLINGVYSDGEARYRIGDLGDGWDSVGVSANDLAWHSPSFGAVVQVNATCDPFSDVPLTSLTNHLLIGFTDREYVSSDVIQLDGRQALRSRVRASLDGVEREILLYVLKKDECTYDFALIAPSDDRYAAAEAAFETFVTGFRTELP